MRRVVRGVTRLVFAGMLAACGEAPVAPELPTEGLVVRVECADAEPAFGVRVEARPVPGAGAGELTVTDTTGAAWFPSAVPGSYSVSFDRPDLSARQALVDVVAGELTDVALTLPDGIDVAGVVVDERGGPVSGASVLVDGRGRWRYEVVSATTDAQGRFALCGLGETQKLKVRHPDYQESRAQRVSADFSITLEDGARSLIGTLRSSAGEPVADSLVELVRASVGDRDGALRFQRTRTNTAGRYAFRGLRHAPATLVAVVPGFATVTRRMDFAEPGVHEFDITLTDGWSVSGVITDVDGAPAAGARVSWSDAPFGGREATSDASGRFVLAHLPEEWHAKDRVIVVDHPEFIRVTSEGRVTPDPAATWDVVLPRGGVITGTVFGPDGALAEEGRVHLATEARRVETTSVRDGRFRFAELEDGVYAVEVDSRARGHVASQSGVELGSDLEFRIVAPGRIRGRVAPNALADKRRWFLLSGDGRRELVRFDEQGTFDEEVPAGEYTVDLGTYGRQASLRGGRDVQVEPGKTLDLGEIVVVDLDEIVVEVTVDGVASDAIKFSAAEHRGIYEETGTRAIGDSRYAVSLRRDGRLTVRGKGVAWAEYDVNVDEHLGRPIAITVTKGYPLDLEVGTGGSGTSVSVLDVVVRSDTGAVVYTKRLPLMKGARPLELSLAPGRYDVLVTDDEGRRATDFVNVTKDGAWLAVHIP